MLLGTTLVGVLALVTVVAAGLVAVVVAHRSAQSAADLAALAGARASQDGRDPCATAAQAASRNRAVLQDCQVSGWEVRVRVGVDTELLPAGRFTLASVARAGPISSLGPTRG